MAIPRRQKGKKAGVNKNSRGQSWKGFALLGGNERLD